MEEEKAQLNSEQDVVEEQAARRFREKARQIYLSFRFAILLPVAPNEDRLIPATSIYNDPFTSEIWIGRAHLAGEKSLRELLEGERGIMIWMMPRGGELARRVMVEFEGLRYLPLELDSTRDEIALEWVVLQKARCSLPADIATADWPQAIQNRR